MLCRDRRGAGWGGQGPYPLPFHPLELGQEALRTLFGFVIEGRPRPNDVDADTVRLFGLRVEDPARREQEERERHLREVMSRMAPPRRYCMGADGTMHELGADDLPIVFRGVVGVDLLGQT